MWNSIANEAFNLLEQAMVTTLVLVLPNFALPFVMEIDGSRQGVRAVLMQFGCPVA